MFGGGIDGAGAGSRGQLGGNGGGCMHLVGLTWDLVSLISTWPSFALDILFLLVVVRGSDLYWVGIVSLAATVALNTCGLVMLRKHFRYGSAAEGDGGGIAKAVKPFEKVMDKVTVFSALVNFEVLNTLPWNAPKNNTRLLAESAARIATLGAAGFKEMPQMCIKLLYFSREFEKDENWLTGWAANVALAGLGFNICKCAILMLRGFRLLRRQRATAGKNLGPLYRGTVAPVYPDRGRVQTAAPAATSAAAAIFPPVAATSPPAPAPVHHIRV